MKKSNNKFFLIFIFIYSILSNPLKAQVTKGIFRLSPQLELASTTTLVDQNDLKIKNNEFGISISAGYFIIDNFEIGVHFTYQSKNTKIANAKISEYGFYYAPALIYMLPLTDKLYLPFTASIGVGNHDGQNHLEYFFSPGLAYIIAKKLGIRFNIHVVGSNYNSTTTFDTEEVKVINHGLRMSSGIDFYFGGEK